MSNCSNDSAGINQEFPQATSTEEWHLSPEELASDLVQILIMESHNHQPILLFFIQLGHSFLLCLSSSCYGCPFTGLLTEQWNISFVSFATLLFN